MYLTSSLSTMFLTQRICPAFSRAFIRTALTAGCIAGDNGVLKSDITSGWRTYSFALPVTALEKTAAKYIVKLAAIIIGAVLTFIGSALIHTVGGSNMPSAVMFCYFICLDLFLIIDIVYQAIPAGKWVLTGQLARLAVGIVLVLLIMAMVSKAVLVIMCIAAGAGAIVCLISAVFTAKALFTEKEMKMQYTQLLYFAICLRRDFGNLFGAYSQR